jgi:hypothetical protein
MKGILLIALLAGATATGMHWSKSTARYSTKETVAAKAKAPQVTKKEVVKLYPNPSYNGTITVSSNSDKPLHFYVFDMDGTLLHQIILKDKKKQTIQHLKKGTYVYDAFLNDEGIDHGSISVR